MITARRGARLAAGGAAGVVIVLLALWLAILYMPLPASQVAPRVAAALQERLGPDYVVSVADAELHRGGEGVELRLVDLAIARKDGPVVAEAPRVELRVDGMSLLTGSVVVRSVHVTNPRLDMQFDTAVGGASVQADLPRRIHNGVADLDRLLGPDGAAGALEEVDVTGATVLVAPRSRAPLTLDGVDLRLTRATGGAFSLTASSARAAERWTTAVTVKPEGDARVIDLGLENVDLSPYSAPFAAKAGAAPLKGRVSGHLSARIGADGALRTGGGRLAARALQIAPPGAPSDSASPGIEFDTLQLGVAWDPAAGALVIEPSRIAGRGGQMSFSGRVVAPTGDRPLWTSTVEGRDVLLAAESGGEPPLRLDRISIDATFDAAAGVFELSKAQFLGPTAKAAMTGLVRFEGDSPAIRLGLVSEPMPASALKRMWPFFMAPAARSWVVENVSGGTVDELTLSMDVPSGALARGGPLPDGSLALAVMFSNATLRGRPELPWVEGAGGRVDASARHVTASIGDAYVSGAKDTLRLSAVRFEAPDITPSNPRATITFKADGGIDPVVTLLASGVVGANPLPAGFDATKVSGRVTADVSVGVDLGHAPAAPGPGPAVAVKATLSDVTIADAFAGRAFENGAFRINVANGKTDLSGKGQIGGAPTTIAVAEKPSADGALKRELTATLTADAGDLTRLGFDVPGTLRGAVPLEASMSIDEPGAPISLSADLKTVGIDGVVPGFRKPVGQPGRLAFTIDKSADKTTVRNFAIESGDRSVRGALTFGPKGEFLSATLPIYRPAPGDDARVEIEKARTGSTKVLVQGASLDLKPLLDAFRGKSAAARTATAGGGAPAMPKTLDVIAKLGTGLGYGGEALAGLDLKLAMRDGKITDADGSARLGAGAIRLATADDGRLRLTGQDAGAFFRLADLYGRIDGGVFDLRASLVGGPGLLRMRDFAVRNEDALVRVRQSTGADRGGGSATRFDRLRIAFVEGGGKIDVKEAALTGPQLGATLEGLVDYSADKVSMVGTFVPAYALNNLFARVPILGALLGGGEHGGLVGVTFQVTGRTGAPVVTINPVSAVAPGFLRKMFEFRQDGGDAAARVPVPSQTEP
ncbi:DUF3971 domain-containing protein [Methylopila henanensis]|uniref:DUF3971 domain-containing protein n=1 Tax=Methylopila henanensis TaxID=873516 RepID=A0ABW4K3L8_9HYPH